ncbi:hypothetical protein [Nitrosomonas halophila]|jgi:hypothetical protein|uniref:Uncharacterized protein n=1 Tax=Nitrosomonas halophila TaxID=44576 RepID=A0A1H3HF79_9PROT|nr:hypothetical protein [Nitrosomonas halophila]SDY13309.1 hypothetical protein SAMN05421881_101935 [Nitrosomonas halophila]
MEDSSLSTLLYSILAIPFVCMILHWIKVRKDRRRNESGEVEYTSFGQAFTFLLIEGVAVIASLSILIAAMSGIVRYVIHTYA